MKKKQFTRFRTTIAHNGKHYSIIVTRDGAHFKLHLIQLIGGIGEQKRNFKLCFCFDNSLSGRLKEYKRVKKRTFEEYSCRYQTVVK